MFDVPFLYFCAFNYAATKGLVNISCEYFDRMLNDVLDKILTGKWLKKVSGMIWIHVFNFESMMLPTTIFWEIFDPQDDWADRNPPTISLTAYLRNGDHLRFLKEKMD